MGHYMTEFEETQNTERFPVLDASVIPYVWLKKGIGTARFVIEYSTDDLQKIKNVAQHTQCKIEFDTVNALLNLALNHDFSDDNSMVVDIELSGGSGKFLYQMFKDILPLSATFENGMYEVKHDHTTVIAS